MKKIKLIYIFLICSIFFLTGCEKLEVESTQNTDVSLQRNETQPVLEENISPPITSADVVPVELASYTTTIYTKTDERQNNVVLACAELSDVIIAPGETFSFCDTLGPATPEDGYQKADTFDSDGDIFQEYGGGKCQVSSTLYNAVLATPNMEIVERHEHSNEVPYVPEGLDAAIAYGSVDLKFKNNNSYSVKIVASATEDEVTVKILKV